MPTITATHCYTSTKALLATYDKETLDSELLAGLVAIGKPVYRYNAQLLVDCQGRYHIADTPALIPSHILEQQGLRRVDTWL